MPIRSASLKAILTMFDLFFDCKVQTIFFERAWLNIFDHAEYGKLCFLFQATLWLNAINKFEGAKKPWRLTYSYGRALQRSALDAWNGNDGNFKKVHEAFAKTAANISKASMGQF